MIVRLPRGWANVGTLEELPQADPGAATPHHEPYDAKEVPPVPDNDDVTPEEFDNYVGVGVNLPLGGTIQAGRVKRRARNSDGEVFGTRNINPVLDTRAYDVEFPTGEVAEYTASTVAENMFARCDANRNQHLLLKSIVDHQTGDKAVKFADRFQVINGRHYPRKTTAGWKLCIEWKNGSTSWERLADLKESYPVEVSEYAKSQGIDHEPASAWWVPQVLKQRDVIVAAVNKRYHSRTHKFGFEVPKTVRRALEIDTEAGNTLWHDAIANEIAAIRVAFNILEDGANPPPGHQRMDCHMIFDIKLDGFRRKARLVAGGHQVDTPAVMTYASVIGRETVRIALTIAALNDLEVTTADVQNAYLTAPCAEKIWTTLGPEFGPDEGKMAVIGRALYGLKSAGASFSNHLADCMRTLGYLRCKADGDLWFKPMVRPNDGFKYYAYMLLYVDDVLCINHDANAALYELDHYFMMKKGSIGDPDMYLGSKLCQVQLDNGVWAWSISSSKYVQEAVKNVEPWLAKDCAGSKLKKRATAPWPIGYVSELDTTKELEPSKAQYYQSLIGVLHWMCELGRVDILTEVSTLASHMALPREGYLEAVYHVFAYLKGKHNSRIVFDSTYCEIDMSNFQRNAWQDFYGDVGEAIPVDMPKPRGKEVDLRLYVDSDHAGDQRTRQSRTGYFILLNSALISWLSKKQATIETSVFGAEFVAMKVGVEALRALRYKLRMMEVPISGPSFVYGDNMSVIHNTQRPDSALKKKLNSICYHAICEAVAMGECLTGHVLTNENPADLASKLIPGGQKQDYLVGKLLYDRTDHD